MAKTSAPLLSFDASGSVAKTVVYGSWRGVPYARRHVIPGNPNTIAQQETRNIFRMLSQMWKTLPAGAVAPWDAFAVGRPFLGVNQFTGQNLRAFRKPTTQSDMALFIGSPGARGGPAPQGIDLTPAATSIAASLSLPSPPAGWSITATNGIAFPDQDPTDDFIGPVVYDTDPGTGGALDFTGLESTTDYVVAMWIEYERPDGQVAYSISLTDTATTTS